MQPFIAEAAGIQGQSLARGSSAVDKRSLIRA